MNTREFQIIFDGNPMKLSEYYKHLGLGVYIDNIMIAGIPFVLAGQLKTNTPHYIHFFYSYPLLRQVR